MVSIRMYLFWTVLLGLVYPLAMTALASGIFPHQAGGSLLSRGGHMVGSELISQKFESARYFWPRPSAVDFNPLPSGGSNLGPTSGDLKKAFDERSVKERTANPDGGEPPQELLFTSASGLDPHISPAAALYQAKRVASARKLDLSVVVAQIERATRGRQWGLFGEPTVNVLTLNLALDGEPWY